MRPEGNSLDLNNLPEEYGKQAAEESSTTTAASVETAKLNKKKNGGKGENGKVYECRFCSLKFSKSQALGGHMNRHRQERETETLYRARQLVYSNEGLSGAGVHFGVRDLNPLVTTTPIPPVGFEMNGCRVRDLNPLVTTTPIPPVGFEMNGCRGCSGDHCLQYFRPLLPRLPATAPLHPTFYPSTSQSHPITFPSNYPPHQHPPTGHVLPGIYHRFLHGHSYGIGTSHSHNNTTDEVRPPPPTS